MKLCPQCESGYHDSFTACPAHGVLLHEIRDLRAGMLVHHSYRIVRKLGQGAMGAVYLADHIYMEEKRALKFLIPELSRDEAFIARFRREVRTLRQIRHPNVVDSGDLEPAEDDSLFFSMEFVDGPDLFEFLRSARHPFDVPLALSIARSIAQGLGAAHALGMVHRDIKPENILMARAADAWIPKIADFGIVAVKEAGDSRGRTLTRGSLLTERYAAPEQWRGMRAAELDGRTDLYALGGILFEMLTGRTAFEAESYEGWADMHRNMPPVAPSTLRPDLAGWPGLDKLVLALLAKDRDHRPANVADVIQSLDAIRDPYDGASPHDQPGFGFVQLPDDFIRSQSQPPSPRLEQAAVSPSVRPPALLSPLEDLTADFTNYLAPVSPAAIALSPDGGSVAAAVYDTTRLWRIRSGHEPANFYTPGGWGRGYVHSLLLTSKAT
jgi:serine/threonine protein kinase